MIVSSGSCSIQAHNRATHLVTNNPDTSKVQALEPPVHTPKRPAEHLGTNGSDRSANRRILSEGVDKGGSVPETGGNDKVTDHVVDTETGLADEEVGGDGSANLAERPPVYRG